MTRFRAVIWSVPTGFDAAGAFSPLLISWRHTRKYSERFIGITRAWGRPHRIEMLAAEVSPHPPFDARVARERTESERREAPSGRARSTTEVRARRTRSFGDDERCDTRDGKGCTQRTAHGEGPRILSPSNESGERRRSAKAKNTPLSTLQRSLLQEVVRTTQWDPRIRCSRRTPFVSAWKPWRGARCSVSDQRALHRAPSPCASQ